MSWRRFRRLILFSVLVAVAVEAIRSLRGPEAPVFSRHRPEGEDPPPGPAAPQHARASSPAEPAPEAEAAATPGSEPEPNADPDSASGTHLQPVQAADQIWAEPIDGGCPPGYPVKAKVRSGIYHEPGMRAYERTRPDRCYATATDAQGDGFRAAKR